MQFHLTPELSARVEQAQTAFNVARLTALQSVPYNPFGVSVRSFGENAVACKVRSPLLRGKNRILNVGPLEGDLLQGIWEWYLQDGLVPSVHVRQGAMTQELFARLVGMNLWSSGSGTVLVASRDDDFVFPPAPLLVRVSPESEKETYLDLFQAAFGHRQAEASPEYRLFQWAEDSLPGGQRYVAEWGRVPVAMASLSVVHGVGICGTAGVLPDFRGKGIQSALIARRIADAHGLGCDLVLGGGSPGTTTYRNFERAGFRLIPSGSAWVSF